MISHIRWLAVYNRTRGAAKDDAPGPLCLSCVPDFSRWQRKYRELATERSVIAQASVATDGAETGLRSVKPAASPMPAQPPDRTAMYCLPPCS